MKIIKKSGPSLILCHSDYMQLFMLI